MISAWKEYGRLARFTLIFLTLFFGVLAVYGFAVGQTWGAAADVAMILVGWGAFFLFARRFVRGGVR